MRGDPWHREPPLRARTVEEVGELGWAIHDCWIDVEGLVPVTIEGGAPLTIEIGVDSLDVSVEARANRLS